MKKCVPKLLIFTLLTFYMRVCIKRLHIQYMCVLKINNACFFAHMQDMDIEISHTKGEPCPTLPGRMKLILAYCPVIQQWLPSHQGVLVWLINSVVPQPMALSLWIVGHGCLSWHLTGKLCCRNITFLLCNEVYIFFE